ncbi:MAG: hypothetical protein AB1700_02255 [Bacillota bacterium]
MPEVVACAVGARKMIDTTMNGKVVGFNRGGFNNAASDELAEKSRAEFDEAKRVKMFHEMQEIFSREIPQVPLYHPIKLMLYRDDRFTGWVEHLQSAIDNWDPMLMFASGSLAGCQGTRLTPVSLPTDSASIAVYCGDELPI